jgi:uncharacterized membrane protein
MALRALSPSINDPFTAINCIDRLGAALVLLAGRALPSRYVRDESGAVRVITDPLTYGGVVEAAFSQIRQVAVGNAAVVIRLLDVIRTIAHGEIPAPYREALGAQLEAIRVENRHGFAAANDRSDFEARIQGAEAALSACASRANPQPASSTGVERIPG